MATGFRNLLVYKCEYITQKVYDDFRNKSEEIGRLLNDMIKYPGKYK